MATDAEQGEQAPGPLPVANTDKVNRATALRVLPQIEPGPGTEEMADLVKFYRRSARQIRRWMRIGREKNDSCPVFAPAKMPNWWTRCMTQTVPEDILRQAIGVNGIPGVPDRVVPNAADSLPLPPIDLADAAQLGEDVTVKQIRTLAMAVWKQLEAAYQKQGLDLGMLHNRYDRIRQLLNKVEAAERQARKEAGNLIPREEIERETDRLCEMLRQMRTSMARRVIELCPRLPTQYRDEVVSAIERVRAREDQIFRRFDKLSSEEEFLSELQARLPLAG
jgi:hypothetical protein